MIITNGMLKNVDFLRARMEEIKKRYKEAFLIGFWFPLGVFVIELFYYVSRLIVLGAAYTREVMGDFTVPDEKQVFFFDLVLFLMPLIYMAFSLVSFRVRSRIMKYPLLFMNVTFIVMCVYALAMEYSDWYPYAIGIIHGIGLFIACVRCIKADVDDELLSKIDGYPHFNPVLMHEELPKDSKIRFPDKKSYDQLYDERMEEYAAQNPDSETAKAYNREKEEKKDFELSDWLSGMLGKNEENQ